MKNSKKLLIAVVALVVAIATATSATFAWFALGNTASVDAFNIGVTAGTPNLLMSVDGGDTYGTSFTAKQLLLGNDKGYVVDGADTYLASVTENADGAYFKYVNDNDASDIVFSDEATLTGYTAAAQKYDVAKIQYELVTPNVYTKATASQSFKKEGGGEGAGNFLELTIKFKADAAEAQKIVLLDDGADYVSTIIPNGTDTSKQTIVYDGAANIASTVYGKEVVAANKFATRAAYAARVGFASTANDTLVTWAPYDWTDAATPATAAAAMEAPNASYYIGNLQADYNTHIDNGTSWAAITPAARTTLVNNVTAAASESEVGTATTLTSLETVIDGYYTGEVKIYIWIEGEDGDAFNTILSDFFSVQMAFASFDLA